MIRARERGNEYWQEGIRRCGFKTVIPYRDYCLLLRLVREVWFFLNLPKVIWFNPKLRDTDDKIYIVSDPLICAEFLMWLREIRPKARILLVYENRVNRTLNPNLVTDRSIEKWTYDSDDAKQYDMNLQNPYYFSCFRLPKGKRNRKTRFDIVYVGRDKGRAKDVLRIQKEFERMGLRTDFHISPDRSFLIFWKRYYKKIMPYSRYLDMVSKSKAILSILPKGQKSITMREMECIFQEKKCITNNKNIKFFEHYDPSRYFILGEDSITKVKDFLELPFRPVKEKDLRKMSYESMIFDMVNRHV